jgi:hypothetical protein
MPRTPKRSAEEQMRVELAEEVKRIGAAVAAELGPAPGVERISDAEEVRQWGIRDPLVDFDALVETLSTTGITNPALLDPANKADGLALVKVIGEDQMEEVAATLSQPMEPPLAVTWATLCEFPMRLVILSEYEDDPEGAVAKANALDKAWTKSQLSVVPSEDTPVAPYTPLAQEV